MANDGPSPVDINQQLFARQAFNNSQPPSANDKATSFDEMVNKIFEATSNLITRATGVKVDSLFSTGAGANFKTGQALVDKSLNQQAQSLSVRGGALAGFTSDVAASGRDFSRIQAPPLQGVEIGSATNMSGADYFTPRMAPLNTPGMGQGMDAGMSFA